jgi:AcrR family transcriptional regulator
MPKLFPNYREEIRKKIIAEAFHVFIEKGFEKTSLDEIAARLDVTKPALYRYFKNKDELFMSAIVETVISEYKQYLTLLFNGDDIMANASIFFDKVLEFSRKYHVLSMDIFTIIKRNRSFLDNQSGHFEEAIRLMQDGFEEKIASGAIHPDLDSRTLAFLISSIIGGLIHFIIEHSEGNQAKEVWLKGFATLTGVEAR